MVDRGDNFSISTDAGLWEGSIESVDDRAAHLKGLCSEPFLFLFAP